MAVHHTFARAEFQQLPALIGYHPNRAVGKFDLNGCFEERPDAWRFVVTRFEAPDGAAHTVGFMPEWLRDLFYADRKSCIGSVAACDVDEHVVVNRLTGQTSLVKYLFLHLPEQYGSAAEFAAHYRDHHLPVLTGAARTAPGLRLFISNPVLQEADMVDRPDGTMAYTGGYRDTAGTYCFDELYFDHEGLAAEFFTSAPVLRVLRDSPVGKLCGYHVEEKCGVDRR
jgi:hypothetical protein